MKFEETPLSGAYIIDLERRNDSRGFFARLFCRDEFREIGLQQQFVQINNSLSVDAGTLRGLHYQLGSAAETKVVRVISGAIWDCILDLRQDSPTFGRWYGAELSAENRRMIYVPKGFAHGFVSLQSNSELFYFVDEFYDANLERGIRWNDPRFGIDWPVLPSVISDRDLAHPDFDPDYHLKLKDS